MDEVEQLLFEGLDAVIYCDTADCLEMPKQSHLCPNCRSVTLLCTLHRRAMDQYARSILLMGQPVGCNLCKQQFDMPLNWVDL